MNATQTSAAPSVPAAPYRHIPLGPRSVEWDSRPDGTWIVRSSVALLPCHRKLTDRLREVAQQHPDRLFLAVKGQGAWAGRWEKIHYAAAWDRIQHIAQSLLDRKLSEERPVALLSAGGIEHALISLAAMHVGIPCSAISPAYSLLSDDHLKLRHVIEMLQPGLVFADDALAFDTAIERCLSADVEVVHSLRGSRSRKSTSFDSLLARTCTPQVDEASNAVAPDAVAKVLFTSGSTGLPKGVMVTQRMLACNQQMTVQSIPAIHGDPLVILSWLPWHHVSGGNQMLGLTIHCAGSFYVDDGKPVAGEVERTVANLREVSPTVYFSVPRGIAMLIPHLRADDDLRQKFFSRLALLYYSGAALGDSLVADFQTLAVETCGERIPIMSGYGATETAPFAVAANWLTDETGLAGLPVPGCELKLVPLSSGKYEARVRGPHVTPGYWRQPQLTDKLFDDEGFARMGDALSFVKPGDVSEGFAFDGRLAEDFKLATGTFVGVGTLRAKLVKEGDGLFLDAVIAGEGRDAVGAFIVGDRAACSAWCSLPLETPWDVIVSHPALRARVQSALDALAARATGSSTYIARALMLREPPNPAAGELTDKGSINQRAFISNRPALIERLYAQPLDADVHTAGSDFG